MFKDFCDDLVKENAFTLNGKGFLQGNQEEFNKVVRNYPDYKNHKFENLRKTLSPDSKKDLIGNPCIGYGLVNQFRAGDHNRYKDTYFINFDPNKCGSGIKHKALGIRIHKKQFAFLHFMFDYCHAEESAKTGLKFAVLVRGEPSDNFCIDLCSLNQKKFKEHITFFLLNV